MLCLMWFIHFRCVFKNRMEEEQCSNRIMGIKVLFWYHHHFNVIRILKCCQWPLIWWHMLATLFMMASSSLRVRRSLLRGSLCSNSRVRPCCSWDTRMLSPLEPPALCLAKKLVFCIFLLKWTHSKQTFFHVKGRIKFIKWEDLFIHYQTGAYNHITNMQDIYT